MQFNDILWKAVEMGASDVHVRVGLPPVFRLHGNLVPMQTDFRFDSDNVKAIVGSILTPALRKRFQDDRQVDLSYAVEGLGRFRVNIFMQRGALGMVLRFIPTEVRQFADLNLPPVCEHIANEHRGLVLVTGTTGSGKSTTLAAMIDHINRTRNCHILTIEDPIEFLHRDRRSIINQREIGFDANTFALALRAALRQDPDVILVGEMRDFETIEIALTAAETGHLVMSTLHTLDASETIMRIITAFPAFQQQQVRHQISGVLKGVISQRLIPTVDGRGRVPALEIMVSTARTRECVETPEKTKELRDAMAQGNETYGMQTFDQSLMYYLAEGMITYEEALRNASNPDDFILKAQGISNTTGMDWGGPVDATGTHG